MSKRVYISGQMSGLPREEYIARFSKAEELLRAEGYDVVNPARLLPCRWPWLYRLMGYRLTILYDLWRLSRCDLIYKIPGWKESHGANIESCWAYHTNIALLYSHTRQRIDLKMVKYIDMADERMAGGGGGDSAGRDRPAVGNLTVTGQGGTLACGELGTCGETAGNSGS